MTEDRSDEDRVQHETEHNKAAIQRRLHEDGFPAVVVRAVSPFTIFVHSRTLERPERDEFHQYAVEEQGWTALDDDFVGDIYRIDV